MTAQSALAIPDQSSHINKSFPAAHTLTGRALAGLLRGERLTHRGFQNETASYRLSEFISQLRHRHHWEIVTHERHGKTQDPTGRWVDYGVYEIPAAVLLEIRAEIGERVEAFIKSVEAFEARGVRSV